MEIKENIKEQIKTGIMDTIEHVYMAFIKDGELKIREIGYNSSAMECSFSEDKIFNILKRNKVKGFYFVHTHPNSLAVPSTIDKGLTHDLLTDSKENGYNLIDHFIYGPTDSFSFKEAGFLYKKPEDMNFKFDKHMQSVVDKLDAMAAALLAAK